MIVFATRTLIIVVVEYLFSNCIDVLPNVLWWCRGSNDPRHMANCKWENACIRAVPSRNISIVRFDCCVFGTILTDQASTFLALCVFPGLYSIALSRLVLLSCGRWVGCLNSQGYCFLNRLVWPVDVRGRCAGTVRHAQWTHWIYCQCK